MDYRPENGRNSLFALGHSCIEYFANIDDEFLLRLGLNKGDSNNPNKFKVVSNALKPEEIIPDCGSVESNVACGYSLLGLPSYFIGSISNDYNGNLFREDLLRHGVVPYLTVTKGNTSVIYTLITPDKERTFVCKYGEYQGVSADELPLDELTTSGFFYSCAYSIDKHLKALERAIAISRNNNVKVTFDVASVRFIKKYKSKIEEIISNTDILFLNEEEAAAFGYDNPFDLIEDFSRKYNLSLIAFKMGKKGSILSNGRKKELLYISSYKVNEVNTSGAGDSYAAGLLYSIAKGYDLLTSGKIASYYASRTVMRLSSRPERINIEGLI